MISNEIKELQKEKMTLEKDLAQKEADVKIKNGELKNLQNEQDALETMLKQLEIQKGEARKRLNDLDKQFVIFLHELEKFLDLTLCDLLAQTEDDVNQIDAMKKQKEEQEMELEVQEKELSEKRKELNELRQEETKLESQISAGKTQLDALTSTLQSTILQISQMKIKIDQLQEQRRLMSEAIKDMDNAISFGDFRNVSEFTLTGFTPLKDDDFTVASPTSGLEISKDLDIYIYNFLCLLKRRIWNLLLQLVIFRKILSVAKIHLKEKLMDSVVIHLLVKILLKEILLKKVLFLQLVIPFGGDPFENVFNVTATPATQDDPFLGSDPFGGFPAPAAAVAANPEKDPFDPFGLSKSNSVQSPPLEGFDADPFGADPFGGSPAAPPRPESPTPALPPKKSKAPPPRPAPPKAKGPTIKPGPTRAAPAPPVPPPPVVDPFKADFENAATTNSAFPDLFSKTATKTQDAFDPFSNPVAPADNFANFDNFADFDNIK
ncbi:epidermal growth factor receptor substrate 15-like 1 [Caerostris extrusa]|uniref:Epidermal growth factor receptor substrate 15-like 1 n=1 Tax=Caerostris extrusa TaxID=172846 RepID=A0AAV4SHQ9_CAEEX|nr:epidermal growth factor receptor substrate 15-like 1 [Caerostris extrusa]